MKPPHDYLPAPDPAGQIPHAAAEAAVAAALQDAAEYRRLLLRAVRRAAAAEQISGAVDHTITIQPS